MTDLKEIIVGKEKSRKIQRRFCTTAMTVIIRTGEHNY